jgi:4-carboxymuconolactone decarboxylase
MGKQAELKAHVKGALNNGLTEEELKYVIRMLLTVQKADFLRYSREVFLQVMVYCGAPAGRLLVTI